MDQDIKGKVRLVGGRYGSRHYGGKVWIKTIGGRYGSGH